MSEEPMECLDRPRTNPADSKEFSSSNVCVGPVELRPALSPTGVWFPRCDKHWEERLEIQEGINRRYPQTAPSDFSFYDAGEYWSEDDY